MEIDFEFKIEVFDLFLKYDGDFIIVDEVGKFVLDKVIEDYLVFLYLGRYNMLRDFFFCVLNFGKYIRCCDDILFYVVKLDDFCIVKYMIFEGVDCIVKD